MERYTMHLGNVPLDDRIWRYRGGFRPRLSSSASRCVLGSQHRLPVSYALLTIRRPLLTSQYGDVGESSRHRFVLSMAILSAIGLALGVLRHYLDIYQERTVRGISWGFVLIDAMGDLTSLLAIGE
jgi:hypothetical protein